MVLSNASVLSVQDGILTLRFARDGDLKGFSTSGCDADLQRVLSSGFGLNVTVKGVVGGDSGPGQAGPAPGPPDLGPETAGPGTGRPAAPRPEAAPRPGGRYDEPPEEIPPEEDEPPPDEPSARPGRRGRTHRDGPDPARARRPGDRRVRGMSQRDRSGPDGLDRGGLVVGSA